MNETDYSWQDDVDRILSSLPDGTWTSYGELGKAVGRGPRQIARYLTHDIVHNAYRVLRSDGRVSDGFHWGNPDSPPVHDVLRDAGVRFSKSLKADPMQKLDSVDLAELLGE
ncbi:MGMT family protein [Salininema proteolyticum]|uniref:MGMT family protein n=1 Tax=Salininema proteolyticum TaxID=1607685 RepID=A0ABV8TY43_9ACTN